MLKPGLCVSKRTLAPPFDRASTITANPDCLLGLEPKTRARGVAGNSVAAAPRFPFSPPRLARLWSDGWAVLCAGPNGVYKFHS